MAQERCPICGEKYDDTYKYCPFCEEMDALESGAQIRRRSSRSGRRSARREMALMTPTLVVLILVMAALLVYLLFGDRIAEKLGKDERPGIQTEEPAVGDETQPGGQEDPVVPVEPEPEVPAATMDYAAAAALPQGLNLSTTDFSLFAVGENHTVTVSGGSGSYQWFSENPAVATVDGSGKVTALSGGNINIVVTDGEKQGTCIVRCRISGSGGGTTVVAPQPETSSGGSLKAGNGKVVNAGGGVRVRGEANTNSEILATLTNGSEVQIIKSAGDGWYEITFSNVGGTKTTGYMKGDYLANR